MSNLNRKHLSFESVTKFITFDLAMLTSMTSFTNYHIFGKLFFAVTSFLNCSSRLDHTTFTGRSFDLGIHRKSVYSIWQPTLTLPT